MNRPRKQQRGDKSDFTLEERLKKENKKLKREVAKLRNLLARVDLERYENLKELVDQQRLEEKLEKARRRKEVKKWKCHECEEGHMQLMIFNRKDGVFYYRTCTSCNHRTRMKKYHKDVEES